MRREQIIRFVLEQGFSENFSYEELANEWANSSVSSILDNIAEYMDQSDPKKIISELFEDQNWKQWFLPEIHYKMVRIHLCQMFEDIIFNNQRFSDQVIAQNIKDPEQIIKEAADLLGRRVSQQQIQYLSEKINPILRMLGGGRMSREELKELELRVIKEFERATQINTEQEIKQYKEDLSSIPEHLIEYKLKKIYVDLLGRSIDSSAAQLTKQEKDIIREINPPDTEGKKAKDQVLNNRDTQTNLKKLKNIICGTDVSELDRMLRKGTDIDLTCLQKNKTNRIIAILGLSHCGKSTLITSLLGYMLVKMAINGISSLQPVEIEQVMKNHQNLIIGHSNRSTTRDVQIYKVPDHCLPRNRPLNTAWYLIDSQGLEDSGGIEFQISNRFSTISLLRKLENVFIVIVINKNDWGTMGQGVKKLAKTFSNLIKDIDDVKDSIKFVFNNFDEQSKRSLIYQLEDLEKNIRQSDSMITDKNFNAFFELLKNQVLNPEQMLTVDPLKMNPPQFLQHFCNKKDKGIQCPLFSFNSELGSEPQGQIQKICKKYSSEFKDQISSSDIEGAIYSLNMLKKIGRYPQLNATEHVPDLEKIFQKKIQDKVDSLKVKLAQCLTINYKKKTDTQLHFQNVKEKLAKLQEEIRIFHHIFDINSFEHKIQGIIEEPIQQYNQKLDKWNEPQFEPNQELIENTQNALAFLGTFAPQKRKEELELLQKKMNQFKSQLLSTIKEAKEASQIWKHFSNYSALQEAIEENKDYSQFSQANIREFLQKKDQIIILNQRNLAENGLPSIPELQEIQKIEDLLKFLQNLLRYPQELIIEIKKEAQEIDQYLKEKLPDIAQKELFKLIEDSEAQRQIDEEEEKEVSDRNKKQLLKVEALVKFLKAIEHIQIIKDHLGGKISEKLKQLKDLLENFFEKFSKIREAFLKNDSVFLRKYAKKMKSEFKKLQKLVQISQCEQVKEKFTTLKQQLQASIMNFLTDNDFKQDINLMSMEPIKRLTLTLKNLSEMKSACSFLQTKQNFPQYIEKILFEKKKLILDPIKRAIDPKANLDVRKYQKLIKYIELLLQEKCLMHCSGKSQLQQLIEKAKSKFQSDFQKQVKQLLQKLVTLLRSNLDLEETELSNLFNEVSSQNTKYSQALSIAYYLQRNTQTECIEFDQELFSGIFNELSSFADRIQAQMEEERSGNAVYLLKKIVVRIINIQPAQNRELKQKYQKIENGIKEKIRKIVEDVNLRKSRFLTESQSTTLWFDAEEFRDIYRTFTKDETENGRQARKELNACYESYQRSVEQKFQNICQIQQDEAKKIKQFFRIVSKYLRNNDLIRKEGIEVGREFTGVLQRYLNYIMDLIINLFLKTGNILTLKDDEITKKECLLFQVSTQLNSLPQYGLSIKTITDCFQNYNEQSLILCFKKNKEERLLKIQKLVGEQNPCKLLSSKDKDFLALYYSFTDVDRNQITRKVQAQFKQEFQNLQNIYNKNYQLFIEFQKEKKQIISKLPHEIKQGLFEELNSAIEKIESSEETKFESMKDRPVDAILDMGVEYKNKLNAKAQKNIIKLILLKEKEFLEGLQFLKALSSKRNKISGQDDQTKKFLEQKETQILKKTISSLKQSIDLNMGVYKQPQQGVNGVQVSKADTQWGIIFSLHRSYSEIRQPLFHFNLADYQTIKRMYLQLFQQLQNTGKKLIEQFQNSKQSSLIDTKFDYLFFCYAHYKKCLDSLFSSNIAVDQQKFSTLHVKIEEYKDSFTLNIEKIMNEKFYFIEEEEKEFIEGDQEGRIQSYEESQVTLKKIKNCYNTYLSPRLPIDMQSQKQLRESRKKEIPSQFQNILRKSLSNQASMMDKRIVFIMKLISKIISMGCQYLNNFSPIQEQCHQILKQEVKLTVNKIQLNKKQMMENEKLSYYKQNSSIIDFISCLCSLKKLGSIPEISESVNEKIKEELKDLNGNILQKIASQLKKSVNPYAKRLLHDQDVFKRFAYEEFQAKTKSTNSFSYVLSKILSRDNLTPQMKKQIEDVYKDLQKRFSTKMNEYIERYEQKGNSIIDQIRQDIKDFSLSIQNNQKANLYKKTQLLAQIFALWSILTSQESNKGSFKVYFKPHATQIISAFILTALDSQSHGQLLSCNRLAEVKTGEGKSVIIAVLAIYFAVFGYEVDCACYSEMLSTRDEKNFENLMKKCGVSSRIKYGTFQTLIKKILSQKDNQGREISYESFFEQAIFAKQPSFTESILRKFVDFFHGKKQEGALVTKKIILIDQIDILFNRKYYGETFKFIIDLKQECIKELLKFIWKNRNHAGFKMISQSKQFKEVLKSYPTALEKLLINQIDGILAALKNYPHQQYQIVDKQIKYQVQGRLQDISFGYNTVFAHMKEYDLKNIRRQSYEEHLKISLVIGEFSYALLPQYYQNVIGVAGTLSCLPEFLKVHLQENYHIPKSQLFEIPSAFDERAQNRRVYEPVSTEKSQHFSQILENIYKELKNNRPILVFFRHEFDLISFYTWERFQNLRQQTNCLTENLHLSDKIEKIKNSSNSCTITLMTEQFIRGVDFKLYDSRSKNNGGFHGIAAYLIENSADLVQANGRVARQGEKGSFIEIYSKQDFQIFGLSPNCQLNKEEIARKRKQIEAMNQHTYNSRLKSAKYWHQETVSIFKKTNIKQALIEYVKSKNHYQQNIKRSVRILLLFDGTGYFDHLKQMLSNSMREVFSKVYTDRKIEQISLEMQAAAYKSRKLQENLSYSNFDSKGDIIESFISNLETSGNVCDGSLEKGLWYAASWLDQVDEIIMFGSSIPSSPKAIGILKKQNPKLLIHSIQQQIQKLINSKVPVHNFYRRNTTQCEEYFEKLSLRTGGRAFYLDQTKKDCFSKVKQFMIDRALDLMNK